MDAEIVKAVNGLAGQWAAFDSFMKVMAGAGMYGFIAAILLLLVKDRRVALSGIFAIVLGLAINYLIKLAYSRPQPFVALEDIYLLVEKEVSASFPSDTAMIAFAVTAAIWFVSRRFGSLFGVLAVLVAFSRMYVGHHFLTDVFAGAVIGIFSTLIGLRLFKGRVNRSPNFSSLYSFENKRHFP